MKTFFIALLMCICSITSFAATHTWDNGDAKNSDWDDSCNWDSGAVPGKNDDVIFSGDAGNCGIVCVDGKGVTACLGSLTFDCTAIAYDLTGKGTVKLVGCLVNDSSFCQTLSSKVHFHCNICISMDGGGFVMSNEVNMHDNDIVISSTNCYTLEFSGNKDNKGGGSITLDSGNIFLNKSDGKDAIPDVNIFVDDGTIIWGDDDQIHDDATMTLRGGTLDTQNFDETIDTLTLTDDSIIDMGTSNTWNISDSSGLAWGASATLVINNWTGNGGESGTGPQIFFPDDTSLTDTQLAQITFFGYSPGAMFLPSGELVPTGVPEPSTVIGSAFLLLAIVYHRLRKKT